jgi:hypothetical protein
MRKFFVTAFSLVFASVAVSVIGQTGVTAWKVPTTRAIVLSGFVGDENGAKESSVVVDADDNMIVRSRTAGSVQINPNDLTKTIGTGRDWQEYVSKFNTKGDLVWNVTWTSSVGGELFLGSHDVGANGDIYVSGYAVGGFDVDPGSGVSTVSGTSSNIRGVVIALNSGGQFKWMREFVSPSNIDVGFVKVMPNGNIAIAGNFEGVVNFDSPGGIVGPTLTAVSANDIFVGVLNSSGAEQWIASIGGGTSEYLQGLTVSTSGNIYVVGGLRGTATLTPATGSTLTITAGSGSSDGGFLWNLSPAGVSTWAVVPSVASATSHPTLVLAHPNGDTYMRLYNNDIVRYSTTGAQVARITTNTSVTSMAALPNGKVLLAGGYSDTKDLDPTAGVDNRTSPHGSNPDGFVTRLTSDLAYESSSVLNLAVSGSISTVFTTSDGQWGITGVTGPATLRFSNPADGTTFAASAGADSMLFIVRYNSDGTTAPPVPGAPSAPVYTTGNKKVTIAWAATLYAARYEVVSSSGQVVCTTTVTSCEVTGLRNGKSYTYFVKGYNYNEVVSAQSSIRVMPGFTLKSTAFKVKQKPLLSSIVTTPSKGTKKYSVRSGSCKIVRGRLVIPSRPGSCKLSLTVTKRGSYPAISTTVSVSFSR